MARRLKGKRAGPFRVRVLRPRVRGTMHGLNFLGRHGRINFRGYQRRMPQQSLNHPDIRATVEHVRCRAVLEPMGMDHLHVSQAALGRSNCSPWRRRGAVPNL